MSNFFALVTSPEKHGGQRFYFNWEQRVERKHDDCDSHSTICKFHGLDEDKCNKYEFNPLTKKFTVDQINSRVNDCVQVEEWCLSLDPKKIIEPLIIKPIVNPLELEPQEVTEQDIDDLKSWSSVWSSVWDSARVSAWSSVWFSIKDSVGNSIWDSVGSSVWFSIKDSVLDSIRASIWASAGASVRNSIWGLVWDSVWAYMSSFFDVEYEYNLSPAIRLWERGFVPSFDGTTWRLHSGKNANIVYEWSEE